MQHLQPTHQRRAYPPGPAACNPNKSCSPRTTTLAAHLLYQPSASHAARPRKGWPVCSNVSSSFVRVRGGGSAAPPNRGGGCPPRAQGTYTAHSSSYPVQLRQPPALGPRIAALLTGGSKRARQENGKLLGRYTDTQSYPINLTAGAQGAALSIPPRKQHLKSTAESAASDVYHI